MGAEGNGRWWKRAKGVAATVVVAACCLGLGAVGGLVAAEAIEEEDPGLVYKLSGELADARAEVIARQAEAETLNERLAEVERRLAELEKPPSAEDTLAMLLPLLQAGLMAASAADDDDGWTNYAPLIEPPE